MQAPGKTEIPASSVAVTCTPGAADFLAAELKALGFAVESRAETAVLTRGTLNDCVRLNLSLRTAHRVLLRLATFEARDARDLYDGVAGIPWESLLAPDGYFSIDRAVDTPSIVDSRYASLKAKDAIVDRMRYYCGRRPDTGSDRSRACVFLQWYGDRASVYLDTSGESLCRRGYRVMQSSAPMRESLAAAVLIASGWRPDSALVNPMCGGGTIAIEAAWMALRVSPQKLRRNFAFMHTLAYDEACYRKCREELSSRELKALPDDCAIIASDLDPEAVNAAKVNAAEAGVLDFIQFQKCDFRNTKLADGMEGHIILNPPYGERMGDPKRIHALYVAIDTYAKCSKPGMKTSVFTGNSSLARKAGIFPVKAHKFYSGALPCELLAGI